MAVGVAVQMRNQVVAALMSLPGDAEISCLVNWQHRTADDDNSCQHYGQDERPQKISHSAVNFTSGLKGPDSN
jgi:hypothetical protein